MRRVGEKEMEDEIEQNTVIFILKNRLKIKRFNTSFEFAKIKCNFFYLQISVKILWLIAFQRSIAIFLLNCLCQATVRLKLELFIFAFLNAYLFIFPII